jgi:hypothetical protein
MSLQYMSTQDSTATEDRTSTGSGPGILGRQLPDEGRCIPEGNNRWFTMQGDTTNPIQQKST